MLKESCVLCLKDTIPNREKFIKALSKFEVMCLDVTDEQRAWFCSVDEKLEWGKQYKLSIEECPSTDDFPSQPLFN